jgi:hypothetical protein
MLVDRICDTSTSTGTGNFTLAGALTGFDTITNWVGTGDTFEYLIEAVDTNGVPTGDWELGVGTYSAANTLTRTTVLRSSTGSAVNFTSGNKRVHLIISARTLSWQGAWVTKGADQTAANYTSATVLTWDSKSHDTNNFWSSGANTLLTIPSTLAGFVYARARCQVAINNITSGDVVTLDIQQNNLSSYTGYGISKTSNATTNPVVSVETAPVLCVGGDTFRARLQVSSDTSIDITAAQSYFTVEILGAHYA